MIMNEFEQNFGKIKQVLISLIPYMAHLHTKDWERMKKSYKKRLEILEEGIIPPKSVIDLAVAAIHPEQEHPCAQHYKCWLLGLNKAIEDAIAHSSHNEQIAKQIKEKIVTLLTTVEATTDLNSDFKNTLNELLVFNFLCNCENIEVIQIEKKLENGKSIDYVVRNKVDGKRIGYEVVTLQNINPEKQDDNESMKAFLNARLKQKYKDKTKELSEIEDLDDLCIFPIIEDQTGLEKFNYEIFSDISCPFHISILSKEEDDTYRVCLLSAQEYFKRRKEGTILPYMPIDK